MSRSDRPLGARFTVQEMPRPAAPEGSGGRVAALVIFAAAMGWLEAVVVVYIRGLLGFGPGRPVPAPAEVAARFARFPWLLPTEQGREAATLVMIAAVAWLARASWAGRFGAFCLVFGVWDLVYYVGLVALVRWPKSLIEMDLLFLLPPSPWWYQPVWVPVAISFVLVGAGWALVRARR